MDRQVSRLRNRVLDACERSAGKLCLDQWPYVLSATGGEVTFLFGLARELADQGFTNFFEVPYRKSNQRLDLLSVKDGSDVGVAVEAKVVGSGDRLSVAGKGHPVTKDADRLRGFASRGYMPKCCVRVLIVASWEQNEDEGARRKWWVDPVRAGVAVRPGTLAHSLQSYQTRKAFHVYEDDSHELSYLVAIRTP